MGSGIALGINCLPLMAARRPRHLSPRRKAAIWSLRLSVGFPGIAHAGLRLIARSGLKMEATYVGQIMYTQSGWIWHDNLALRPLADTLTASGRTCPVVPT